MTLFPNKWRAQLPEMLASALGLAWTLGFFLAVHEALLKLAYRPLPASPCGPAWACRHVVPAALSPELRPQGPRGRRQVDVLGKPGLPPLLRRRGPGAATRNWATDVAARLRRLPASACR